MAETTQQTIDKAQAAFDAARQALEAAQHSGGADAAGAAVHVATRGAIDPFVLQLAIFALTAMIGYFAVCAVTPALHRPLLSVANAISSAIVVGALLSLGVDASVAGDDGPLWARTFGFIALVLASANLFGGFTVARRVLAMYRKRA
jgi:H+-translocating NAD(P) transhydrogenase subunit alpha